MEVTEESFPCKNNFNTTPTPTPAAALSYPAHPTPSTGLVPEIAGVSGN